jgi:hypothetical protein
MREIIARIVDGSEFEEYRPEMGQRCCADCAHWRLGRGYRGESEARDGGSRGRERNELSLAA